MNWGGPFLMSADVPANLTAVVRKAFADTMKDPGFLVEAEKELLPVQPLSGEAAARIVADMLKISPAVAAKVKKIFYD